MKEMHLWTPRQPSQRIARRLFGKAHQAPAPWRRAELWGWLAPTAACALTLMLAVGGMNRRAESGESRVNPDGLAAVMPGPDVSNTQQLFRLTQMDENVQWNVWPALTPPGASSAIQDVRGGAATNLIR
jgi:hypothetical protein